MKQLTHSANGNPTVYGFSCGYIQSIDSDTLHKELYREHGVYHVRSLRNNTPTLNTLFDGPTSHNYVIWMSYYTLGEAKRLYNAIK